MQGGLGPLDGVLEEESSEGLDQPLEQQAVVPAQFRADGPCRLKKKVIKVPIRTYLPIQTTCLRILSYVIQQGILYYNT